MIFIMVLMIVLMSVKIVVIVSRVRISCSVLFGGNVWMVICRVGISVMI